MIAVAFTVAFGVWPSPLVDFAPTPTQHCWPASVSNPDGFPPRGDQDAQRGFGVNRPPIRTASVAKSLQLEPGRQPARPVSP